jgi:hypothetical protein
MRDRPDRSSRAPEVAKRRENFFERNQVAFAYGLRAERGETPQHRDVSRGTEMPKGILGPRPLAARSKPSG